MTHSKLGAGLLALGLSVLAGCAGFTNASQRGDLNRTTPIGTFSATTIDANAGSLGMLSLSGAAKCDVTLLSIDYATIGVRAGEVTNSTGAMLLPSGPDCPKGPYPLLAYARGADALRSRTLANQGDAETALLATIYAAHGYAVVATDYLGYAGSHYPYHPYLHADSEASSVVDSIRAARHVAREQGLPLSGKVMVAGYSQGGHASMAAQRAIERDLAGEINLVASGHMSGPYNVSQSLADGVRNAILRGQFFFSYFITSAQKVYGDIYDRPADVFVDAYASGVEELLPGKRN